MRAPGLFASAFAATLIGAPAVGLAHTGGQARANAPYATGNAPYATGQRGSPTGMTGTYRGWNSRRGSGAGANNFVGNGRGNPRQAHENGGNFGGWFANNHHGVRR